MYAGEEKREYKRIKRHFIASFQVKPDESQETASAGWAVVTLQNLGAGGLLFNYDKEVKLGSIVDIKINFPPSKGPIECVGKIIRIERPPYLRIFHIAVVFIEIGEKEKELINKIAEEFYLREGI